MPRVTGSGRLRRTRSGCTGRSSQRYSADSQATVTEVRFAVGTTEKVYASLEKLGYETGLDPERLAEASKFALQLRGRASTPALPDLS
jgi:hypothetical protein